MDKLVYNRYVQILKDELIMATGCTEPISLAYAAALGRDLLGKNPEEVTAKISGSIIKNVKSVVVPNTGGLKGIEAAIAAGIIEGSAEKKLEVLANARPDAGKFICEYMKTCPINVVLSRSALSFDIWLEMKSGADTAEVRIAANHTNVVLLKRNDEILLELQVEDNEKDRTETSDLRIDEIYEFSRSCKLEDVSEVIKQQISCNSALAEEGLKGGWGAEIGKTLLAGGAPDDILLRAKASAAAGSDARMGGCKLPAVINSGSGNQGVTIAMTVIEYAKALNSSREQLIRALVLANLSSVRVRRAIGCLSAYCGAVCAGCCAAAGVAYLHGASYSVIEQTIVNGLAILSGTVCDGAKPSCAAKIAMSVESGILGFQLAQSGREFTDGEGIVKKCIESTIDCVGKLGSDGMQRTNEVILAIMLDNH